MSGSVFEGGCAFFKNLGGVRFTNGPIFVLKIINIKVTVFSETKL